MKTTLRLFRNRVLADEWAAAYVKADPAATWKRSRNLIIVGRTEAIYIASIDRSLVGLRFDRTVLDESLAP